MLPTFQGAPRQYNNNNLGGWSSLLAAKSWIRKDDATMCPRTGMQGRLQLPATSTHYDHGEQPRSKVFDFSRGRKTRWSEKPSWHCREPTHNSTHNGPGWESNRGHLGERRALYAQANRATYMKHNQLTSAVQSSVQQNQTKPSNFRFLLVLKFWVDE